MKKEKLHISFDEVFDYKLIGVSCHEKDYRLCWAINQSLGIDLSRVDNLGVEGRNHIEGFPFFEYHDKGKGIIFRLLANRFEGKVLMKELKTIDFLFLLKGLDDTVDEIDDKLSAIDMVIFASEIEVENLKEKDLLYLDI